MRRRQVAGGRRRPVTVASASAAFGDGGALVWKVAKVCRDGGGDGVRRRRAAAVD